MEQPRIQYAKTKDGVSIAFWVIGEGMPLVFMPNPPFSHIQMEWKDPNWRSSFEGLAAKRKLVHYDNRGSGMSARAVTDYSLDGHLLDLDAVANRLDLERFALLTQPHATPIAIAYAARHRKRVSHLILASGYARASDYWPAPRLQALLGLLDRDWEMYTEAAAQFYYGWGTGEPARWFARYLRECVSHEGARAVYREFEAFDVTALLPQVGAQTLVLHQQEDPLSSLDASRQLASAIPDARLVVVEAPKLGGDEEFLPVIDEFLSEGEAAPAAAKLPEGMAVLLFADIAESTALTEQLGDSAFRAKARELDTSLRSVIRESGGTPVEGKVLGDGVLAVFTSARQAIDSALRCEAAGEPLGLRLHLGIHAGDIIREGNNVYGGAVNIAARIAAASAPGEVLVSDVLRGLARTSAGVTFDDRGLRKLKGVEGRQRLFAVGGEAGG